MPRRHPRAAFALPADVGRGLGCQGENEREGNAKKEEREQGRGSPKRSRDCRSRAGARTSPSPSLSSSSSLSLPRRSRTFASSRSFASFATRLANSGSGSSFKQAPFFTRSDRASGCEVVRDLSLFVTLIQ